MNDSKIKQIYYSKQFQIGMDICRILTLILVVILIIIMVKNIEEVKILGSDPCQVCINKTGATCFIMDMSFTRSNDEYMEAGAGYG